MALEPIKVGSPAPDFELPSHELGDNGKPGRPIRLSDYFGKRTVVLVFYPLDFSPVCSSENACFQKSVERYDKIDAQLLGISVDSAWTHAAFARELGLGYPLLADFHPRGEVARKYGLYLEESGYTARATVVVGKDGLVKMVQVQQIPEPRSGAKLLEFLEKLAASEG